VFVPRPGPRYTEEQARVAVSASLSYAEALRRLGMRPAGGNWKTLRRYATEVWGIPVDHFDPRRHQREALSRGQATPLEQILVENCHYNRGRLKARLYSAGLKQRRCEMCGQDEHWHGKRMSLILDHANGVATDNRLDNLRIVCPNCAATLETHCGRNKKLLRSCAVCEKAFHASTTEQRHCSRGCGGRSVAALAAAVAARTVERPPYEQLVREVAETSWSAVGRKYGVSDNAVRKWVRWYESEARAEAA
jgi:hypothetical protein